MGGQAEGEAVLAMELAWRAAALEALQAYMASILPHASRSQGTRVQRMLSSLLQPTLDAVCTSPALQVGPSQPFAASTQLHVAHVSDPRLHSAATLPQSILWLPFT